MLWLDMVRTKVDYVLLIHNTLVMTTLDPDMTPLTTVMIIS